MAVLKTKTEMKVHADREVLRVFPVTAKLTKAERKAVTEFTESRGLARGQWIRDVILAELESARSNAVLTEIVGVRLLLVNVLRPLAAGQKLSPEAFDKLLDDISTAKHELASKLTAQNGR